MVGTLLGLMFLRFGAVFLLGGLTVGTAQQLTVDGRSLRRTGSGPQGDLEWAQVDAVGLRVRERSRNPMTSSSGIHHRPTITLFLAVGDNSAPAGPPEDSSLASSTITTISPICILWRSTHRR